ncbi:hypothetical protein AB0H36_48070 [Kribbella sp. NPDC050820]|uniref:hypothetical protein n=1 Tax=Kribbella sp. NPDC050820 TaxID=3155408 RepID=UPI00340D7E24
MTSATTFRSRAASQRELRDIKSELNDLREAHGREDRRAWVKPALVSSAITLVVAMIAAWGTWSATRFSADEDREKESREKRSQIYAEYLAAARSYLKARGAMTNVDKVAAVRMRALEAAIAARAPAARIAIIRRDADRITAMQDQLSSEEATAETSFLKQADLIYVYGSDDAWRANLAVSRAAGGIDDAGTETPFNFDAANAALREFQGVFCKEASATPRKGCGQ